MTKPLGHKSYGSIPHLPSSRMGLGDHCCELGMARIATAKTRDKYDRVIVQEKLDGSNVSVAKIDGMIVPLVRSGYVANTSPYEQHHHFANWVYLHQQRFFDFLENGERICGEWLAQAHGTRYNLPHEPFVGFDLMRGSIRSTWDELRDHASCFDIITPRLLSDGAAFSIESALKSIEVSGHGAIDPVEGAIWRVERIDTGKVDFLVKYVRPEKKDGCYLPEINGKTAIWNWKSDFASEFLTL